VAAVEKLLAGLDPGPEGLDIEQVPHLGGAPLSIELAARAGQGLAAEHLWHGACDKDPQMSQALCTSCMPTCKCLRSGTAATTAVLLCLWPGELACLFQLRGQLFNASQHRWSVTAFCVAVPVCACPSSRSGPTSKIWLRRSKGKLAKRARKQAEAQERQQRQQRRETRRQAKSIETAAEASSPRAAAAGSGHRPAFCPQAIPGTPSVDSRQTDRSGSLGSASSEQTTTGQDGTQPYEAHQFAEQEQPYHGGRQQQQRSVGSADQPPGSQLPVADVADMVPRESFRRHQRQATTSEEVVMATW